MPVIKRIARLTEHHVTTGETLESVARDHGLTVEQLAKFNWNVTDPQQINNRLRTDVGASRRSSDSRFFVFDDSDDPGIILVPSGFREAGLETDRLRPHIIRVRKKQVDPNLITCCRIPGITFAFDKSFIRPSVVHFLKRLEHALEQHPDAKIMIFGHTDRSGPPLYNKKLSERRAKSVHAFITDQPDIWEELFQLERWGDAVLRSILADLGLDSGSDTGGSDGDMESAVRAYQDFKPELVTDGIAGPKTRRAMFLDYMTGKHDIRVTDDQFVDQKFMGCGEFNPLVEPNEHELANNGRGESPGNEENRRVVFYLFRRPPREIPCRLRDLGPCRREIAKHPGQRTDRDPNPPFACEFYDRIAAHCRCESMSPATGSAVLSIILTEAQVGPDGKLLLRRSDQSQEVRMVEAERRRFGRRLFRFEIDAEGRYDLIVQRPDSEQSLLTAATFGTDLDKAGHSELGSALWVTDAQATWPTNEPSGEPGRAYVGQFDEPELSELEA